MKEYKVIDCGPGQIEDRINDAVREGFEVVKFNTNVITQYSFGDASSQYIGYSVLMVREIIEATAAIDTRSQPR